MHLCEDRSLGPSEGSHYAGGKSARIRQLQRFFWVRTLGTQVRTQGSHLVLLAIGVRTRGTQVRTSGTQVRTPSCWVRTRTWQASVCVVQVQVFAPLRSAGL